MEIEESITFTEREQPAALEQDDSIPEHLRDIVRVDDSPGSSQD